MNQGKDIASDYRSLLAAEYLKKKQQNPLFSIRAYSRVLGVSKTALADVLSGKRHLSKKNGLKVASSLSLSPEATKKMLSQMKGVHQSSLGNYSFHLLDDDTFSVISDWYHYAILNLARISSNRSDPRWVARRLGITPLEARSAILRLVRLNMLEVQGRRLKRTTQSLDTNHEIPSSALRKYHRQNLRNAEASMDRDPVPDRLITSTTMAIRKSDLEAAKKIIMRFRNRMGHYLESNEPDSVYTFAMQLFPVVRSEEKK